MQRQIFTIGHSNHTIETFIGLLRKHGIAVVGDVRSHPYSKYHSQFSLKALKSRLDKSGFSYMFLGKELGARSENPICYVHGKVQFDLLAEEPCFSEGLDRVRNAMESRRIALMCAEKDPLNCHRAVLVARKLYESGIQVEHIHADGSLETHENLELRLMSHLNIPEGDLFRSRVECLKEAYAIQGEQIAYEDKTAVEEQARARA